jgi:hypothetical protein
VYLCSISSCDVFLRGPRSSTTAKKCRWWVLCGMRLMSMHCLLGPAAKGKSWWSPANAQSPSAMKSNHFLLDNTIYDTRRYLVHAYQNRKLEKYQALKCLYDVSLPKQICLYSTPHIPDNSRQQQHHSRRSLLRNVYQASAHSFCDVRCH